MERLSASLIDEIEEAAPGRSVDVTAIDDRTGRGLGSDLRALLRRRLDQRTADAARAPVLFAAVLAETPTRLIVSARLTDTASGELLGLLSISEAVDEGWIHLRSLRRPATRRAVDVVSRVLSAPLPEPLLDLAWDGDDLVLLSSSAVRLARRRHDRVEVLAELELRGPTREVRAPAGTLRPTRDGALWALTNTRDEAVLVARRGPRLEERSRASSVAYDAGAGQLSFRAGTNQLVLRRGGAEPETLLAVADGFGVDPRGILLRLGPDASQLLGLRVGSALAVLWDGTILTSSPSPPDEPDAVHVAAVAEEEAFQLETIETLGAIVALAARRGGGDRADVAAIVEANGDTRLLFLELTRREPLDLPGDAP